MTERRTAITSEGEIRVGDYLELRACRICSRLHRFMVTGARDASGMTYAHTCEPARCLRAFSVLPPMCTVPGKYEDLAAAIRERRLFRIDDATPEAEQSPYVRERERT